MPVGRAAHASGLSLACQGAASRDCVNDCRDLAQRTVPRTSEYRDTAQLPALSTDIYSNFEPDIWDASRCADKTAGHRSYKSSSYEPWVQNSKIVRAESRITQRYACTPVATPQAKT